VDEIGSLEAERMSLETELDRAKRANESGSSKVTSVQLEGMKTRYEKVKQELESVKDEKRAKENSYRTMQKEARTCDALQGELQKLKENKVALMREQKLQSQQVLQLKKEQLSSAAQSKRVDILNTKQVNNLRGELTKKERVLGIKDKEMGRVCSKLKACEEHITKLLKLNRTRTRQGGGGKRDVVALGDGFNIATADAEQLATTKGVLDGILSDRVLYTCARAVYERKTKSLGVLNLELQEESRYMEALVSRLQESEERSGTAEDLEDIRRDMRACETNIDRISRDLDLFNADLDEIAVRISTLENSSSEGSFNKLGKEIVTSLKLHQLQSLAWDLVREQLDALESLRQTSDQLEEVQDRLTGREERVRELEGALHQTDHSFKSRLAEVMILLYRDNLSGGRKYLQWYALCRLRSSVSRRYGRSLRHRMEV
jgi:chromosome segregation ATPase